MGGKAAGACTSGETHLDVYWRRFEKMAGVCKYFAEHDDGNGKTNQNLDCIVQQETGQRQEALTV